MILGVGWGFSGICPGPAIVGLSSGLPSFYLFGIAMLISFYFSDFYKAHQILIFR